MYFAKFKVERELGGLMEMTDGLYRVTVLLYPGHDTVYSRVHFPGHKLDAPAAASGLQRPGPSRKSATCGIAPFRAIM